MNNFIINYVVNPFPDPNSKTLNFLSFCNPFVISINVSNILDYI